MELKSIVSNRLCWC